MVDHAKNLPFIIGVGRCIDFWDGSDGIDCAPSPLGIATEASQNAIRDSGVLPESIDAIGVIRTMEDSTPFGHPFGENDNLPGTLTRNLEAIPRFAMYSDVGGQSPQKLVN